MSEFTDTLKAVVSDFMRDNAEDLAGLPQDLIKAGISTGVASAIPKKYMTPELNNLKMKYASEALNHAADHKARMDKLRTQLKDQVVSALWKAASTAALGALF